MNKIAAEAYLWERVDQRGPDECWPYMGYRKNSGYGYMFVEERETPVTHLVYNLTHSEPLPRGHIVRHRCDNPPCCNPSHLQAGTHKDNMRDCRERGRWANKSGELNGQAKISLTQAREIRCAEGTHQQIADRYGISRRQVGRIKQGLRWRSLTT